MGAKELDGLILDLVEDVAILRQYLGEQKGVMADRVSQKVQAKLVHLREYVAKSVRE